jgi:iron(III) transport system substrate-binding protein
MNSLTLIRTSITGGLIFLLVGALGACGGSGGGASSDRVVNIYSARHYDSDDTLYQTFTEKTGVKVNVVEGKDDELIERIKTEGQNGVADVLITVDAGRLWRAEQAQVLQPVQSQVLSERVPGNLRHPQGYWFGLTKRARVLVYNKNKVNPTDLSTYEALSEPQWKGRVCVRSSSNVYNQSLLGSMIESRGLAATQAWAKGLVANFARAPEGGDTDQIEAVSVGVCDVAIVNHYYLARMQQSTDPKKQAIVKPLGIFFPNQQDRGTHVNISGAGVVVNAPHKTDAIAFIEFLTSPEAQQVFAGQNDEFPMVKGVSPPSVLKQYGTFKEDTINVSTYGKHNPEAVKLADQVGWQ